jgi:hypothetical protein
VEARGVDPPGSYRSRCAVESLYEPARVPAVISSPDFRCLCCKRRSSRPSARTRYLQWCLRRTGTDVTHVTCVYLLLAAALDVSRLIRTVRRRHVTTAEPLVTGTFSIGTPDNRRSGRFRRTISSQLWPYIPGSSGRWSSCAPTAHCVMPPAALGSEVRARHIVLAISGPGPGLTAAFVCFPSVSWPARWSLSPVGCWPPVRCIRQRRDIHLVAA